MQFDPGLEYQPNRGERDNNSWLMYCSVFTDGPYSFLWTSYLKSNSRSDYVICISAFAFASKPAAGRLSIPPYYFILLERVTPSGVDVRLKRSVIGYCDNIHYIEALTYPIVTQKFRIYNIFHYRWWWTSKNSTATEPPLLASTCALMTRWTF